MDLPYLLSLEPVYSTLCSYLPTQARLGLLHVSDTVREIVGSSPSTWSYMDLSGYRKDVIIHHLQHKMVIGALQYLILDCTDVSEMTIAVILLRCPNIRYLSLGGAMDLLDGVLESILNLKRSSHARRLTFLALLGAPHFKTTGINAIAASIVHDFAKVGIETDLIPCSQQHAFTSDPSTQWHLCTPSAMHCATCKQDVRGCYPCMNGRTCRGCFKFWCFDCPNPITRVCYECGHSCLSCKQGIYVRCTECHSMFCKLHRDTSTKQRSTGRLTGLEQVKQESEWCDWCIQGKATSFRERYRC